MRKLVTLLMLFCAAIAARPQSKVAHGSPQEKTKLRIAEAMKQSHIPGLAIAVIQDKKLQYTGTFGRADIENNVPVSRKSMFQLASISKTFIALSTLTWVEQGKLRLDDAIGAYLPSLPSHWHRVSVRQLLNHTSGITSFTNYDTLPCAVGKDVRDYKKGDVLAEVACLPLQFEPGTDWSYGDTGFYILVLLIEKLSAQEYKDFLRINVFEKIGMSSSRIIDNRDIIMHRASGYSMSNGTYYNAKLFEFDEFSIISNIDDFARMYEAFIPGVVLKKETLAEMCSPTRLKDGRVVDYGLGIGLTSFQNTRRIGHNGGGGLGFACAFAHFPEKNLTVVILCNADQPRGFIGELANEIAAFYFN